MPTTTIRLNRAECAALGVHLMNLSEDKSEEHNELSLMSDPQVPTQVLVNGAFLHEDGEWATYADMHRENYEARARRAAASE